MKCVELEATKMVVLAECGGHTMQKGDKIVVDDKVSSRMCLQHGMKRGDEHEIGVLKYNFWQPTRMTVDNPNFKKKEAVKVSAAVESSPIEEVTEDVAANKSMGNPDGSAKKKKKAGKKTSAKG